MQLVLVLATLEAMFFERICEKWPDPGQDPLIFVSNPIEAGFPSHWMPLSVMKKIIENRAKPNTNSFKKSTKLQYIPNKLTARIKYTTTSYDEKQIDKDDVENHKTPEPNIDKDKTSKQTSAVVTTKISTKNDINSVAPTKPLTTSSTSAISTEQNPETTNPVAPETNTTIVPETTTTIVPETTKAIVPETTASKLPEPTPTESPPTTVSVTETVPTTPKPVLPVTTTTTVVTTSSTQKTSPGDPFY